jgi:peptidoglycan/xylan/chitin deacetylase (PgdA/CDA1 family)
MKLQLKRLLIPAFASKPVSALASAIFGRGVPIFMIHRMVVEGQPHTGTTPEHLENCLNYLKQNEYIFVSLEDFILALTSDNPLPDKAAVFTMDDGFYDQGQIAVPIFRKFECPVTFFVITGMLDQALWPWDAQVSWIIDNSKLNSETRQNDAGLAKLSEIS